MTLPTPYLELDLDVLADRYVELARALPGTRVHYAVKANPHPSVLDALAGLGSRFDVASPAEVMAAVAAGAVPSQLLYSNPIKRRADIADAYHAGVRPFAVDTMAETEKVADCAPGSSVLCRLLTTGEGSDWPLSRKYGALPDEAVLILDAAANLGLDPAGATFHVGSQQREPAAWRRPIIQAQQVFAALRRMGHRPWLLDLGGGFPASLEGGCPSAADYGAAIRDVLRATFPHHVPETVVEPGRGLVGDAGELVTRVVAVCWRGGRRWVYLDAGVFTGLVETLDEAVRYPILTSTDGGPTGPRRTGRADLRQRRCPLRAPARAPSPGPGRGRHGPVG